MNEEHRMELQMTVAAALWVLCKLGPEYRVSSLNIDWDNPKHRIRISDDGLVYDDTNAIHDMSWFTDAVIIRPAPGIVKGGDAIKWAMENPGKEFRDDEKTRMRWSNSVIEYYHYARSMWIVDPSFDFGGEYELPISGWEQVSVGVVIE